MARYLEVANDLRRQVETILNSVETGVSREELARQLGHAINLAVRCAPRAVQSTVRGNIVRTAVGNYCNVTMTKEEDENTGRTYNKILIETKM